MWKGTKVSHGQKKSKIQVLCKEDLDLEQFCLYERFQVVRGLKTNFVRPASREYVVVTVMGFKNILPISEEK